MKNRCVTYIFLMMWLPLLTLCQTPTQSYLDFIGKETVENELWGKPQFRSIKYKNESVARYEPIIRQIIQKEAELGTEYYFFYTSFLPDFLILQELYKSLNYILNGVQWNNFEYLRAKKDLFQSMNKIDDFFNFVNTQEDKTDHNPELRKVLLSTNLSFPGNLEHQESTFFQFTDPISQLPTPQYEKLYESFLSAAINELAGPTSLPVATMNKFIRQLKQLRTYLEQSKEGLLLQMAIPKQKVDQYAYLSSDYGFPYGREPYEKSLVTSFSNLWNNEQSRFVAISPILEVYQNDPKKIGEENMKVLQARVILSKDLFSSPDSGVKMFKYTMLNIATMESFKQKIISIAKNIADAIISLRAKDINK